MGDKTGISWTEHTWNPWRGCKRISPGCENCYMFAEQRRYGRDPAEVVRTKTWDQPKRWQAKAALAGKRELVFTCSWSDFFIEAADAWRPEAWQVIKDCPNLIWQILTKRPGLIAKRLPADWGTGYPNVWLGVSVESPEWLWRVDVLRKVPAAVHFISAEPLLADIAPKLDLRGIEWVIVGGESGNHSQNYREMKSEWARSIRDLCREHGTAFHFKQSSGPHSGMGTLLDGQQHHHLPEGIHDATA